MKKILSILTFTLFTSVLTAQVSKTVDLATAGTLTTLFSVAEKNAVTNLIVTGNIDARDVKYMRDQIPNLSVLDLSGSSIKYYNGSPADEMPISSFEYINSNNTLKTVILPNSITSIGRGAFNGCSGLISIGMPNTVKFIGNAAFGVCSALTNILLPNTLIQIGEFAFSGCSSLTNVNIPKSVTSIQTRAFLGCSNISNFIVENDNVYFSSVDGVLFDKNQSSLIQYPAGKKGTYSLPVSVYNIYDYAFYGCSGLTSLTLNNGLSSIGTAVFEGCTGIIEFIVEPENINFISTDGILFNKSHTNLIRYPAAKIGAYSIPNNVNTIGDYAFSNCIELTSIVIPNTIISIGYNAFVSCIKLNSIYALASTPIYLPVTSSVFSSVFSNVDISTCTLFIQAGLKAEYQSANQWKYFVNIVEVVTGLQSIIKTNFHVFLEGGKLIVTNAEEMGNKIQIYTVLGVKIREQSIEGHQTNISIPNGIYIIRVGNYSTKILVNNH